MYTTHSSLVHVPTFGRDPGPFHRICDVAAFFLYIVIADCGRNYIQMDTHKGGPLAATKKISYPYAIAIHPKNGMTYVGSGNNQIQVLNRNLVLNNTLGKSHISYFHNIKGIAIDNIGNVYVVDSNTIIVLTAEGNLLRMMGTKGKGEGKLNGPNGIAVDSDGIVYVSESTNQCVSLYTTEGKFLTSIGGKELPLNERISPRGVAVDKKGNVYVIDGNTGIKRF